MRIHIYIFLSIFLRYLPTKILHNGARLSIGRHTYNWSKLATLNKFSFQGRAHSDHNFEVLVTRRLIWWWTTKATSHRYKHCSKGYFGIFWIHAKNGRFECTLKIIRVWLTKKFQNISYHNSTNITSISVPDRFFKRGNMYLSCIFMYIGSWKN